MSRMLCGLFLLCTFAFGQVGQSHPQTTPPTFPENHPSTPSQQMPPDTQAPPPESMSAEQVQARIQQQFASEPSLATTNLSAEVDESSVVLTGAVDTERQHQLALQIAKSYAGERDVVDKIKLKTQT